MAESKSQTSEAPLVRRSDVEVLDDPRQIRLTPKQREEMDRKIYKTWRAVQDGIPEQRHTPRIDPYDVAQIEQDQMQEAAKKPEVWKKIMEYYGFTWYSASDLDAHPMVGPARYRTRDQRIFLKPQPCGQWRNDLEIQEGFSNPPERLKMAFTLKDLILGFRTPEQFDKWMKKQISAVISTQMRMSRNSV